MMGRKGAFLLLFSVFTVNFLSLVFQVIWIRKLMVIFGTTALSISTILTVFLSGIALGGYLGCRWVRTERARYRYLAASLLVLGAYCILSVWLLDLVRYPFQYLSGSMTSQAAIDLTKLFLSFLVLIMPTTIIGSIFPVVTQLYSGEFRRLGRDVASIYFLDTLGAAAGALLCGFYLVPVLGLKAASVSSGIIYMVLGAFIYFSARGVLAQPDASGAPAYNRPGPSEKPGRRLDATRILVLMAMFVSGFAALTLEVTWSRYFHLLFGTSIYAFSLVVAAFLLGLSAGSVVIHRYLDGMQRPLVVFAWIEIAIAAFSLVILQTSGYLESFYYHVFYRVDNFYLFQSVLFVAAFVLMLVPTSLMGANFPLAVRIFAKSGSTSGEDVGLTFAVNTAGGILGAFAAGFIVLPLLGLARTGLLASGLYLAVGFVFLIRYGSSAVFTRAASASVAAVFLVLVIVTGAEPELNYSVYYNGIRHKTLAEFQDFKDRNRVLFSRHGHYGLVTVSHDPKTENTYLMNNGKIDASTSIGDTGTQLLMGHLPLFLHPAPERVLNIGLGGGFTLGAIKAHPDVDSVDTVEIDPLVVEATASYFAGFNNDALNDSRVNVHVQDGRHYLETTEKSYDVIISEPPNIWVSGVSQLFTREFYEVADRHLNDGGILAQWVPSYEMDRSDIMLIIATLSERFGHVAYWTDNVDVIIVASHTRPSIDPGRITRLMGMGPIYADLNRLRPGMTPEMMTGFLTYPSVGFDETRGAVRGVLKVNTDNLPHLEFRTARNIFNKARISYR